jgi:hypothetical protein
MSLPSVYASSGLCFENHQNARLLTFFQANFRPFSSGFFDTLYVYPLLIPPVIWFPSLILCIHSVSFILDMRKRCILDSADSHLDTAGFISFYVSFVLFHLGLKMYMIHEVQVFRICILAGLWSWDIPLPGLSYTF